MPCPPSRLLAPLSRSPRLAALALVTLMLVGCGGEDQATAASAPAATLAVGMVPVQAREIERSVTVSGPVAAWEEMQLGVEVSGLRVTALHVDVGQVVRRGQVLLELDHRMLDSDLAQSRAALAEAEAGLQLAQANLNRGQALANEKLISASALDELRAARVQAQARRATAAAARDASQLRRDFASLRAPDDGVISKRLVQPGQVVAAGGELLRLIRQGRLEWRAELADAELALVRPGMTVRIATRDGEVTGRVRAVSPGVDAATRTGTVHADLPQPGALQAGSFVEGRIATGRGNALVVPAASVVQRDGHAYVFTADDGRTVRRLRVRTGSRVDGRVEILEGLKAGMRVVNQGAGFLGDGDLVRVIATPTAAPATANAHPATAQ
ncbi:efflux RND transporter periplasmic adaptor subunit [Montanilutibacter psychrotolerans]|uniref:Efflux RND transporter periplasmic adaptor subunit n=1 Tax=Montanilutibacter psychrotolerans TaxID=1327343 RepID=A0A3M8SSJ8_9GAMM|nr:efflux RND transporter periplasmic adaptor subunit [Lysobacter psychrotolerans]RNF83665.1 efflux RND transporter periplasmic adaptor subunit [Lysobacter psychrotolerans]